MKVTEDQLRTTYSQKETDELLELQSSGTLTDLAQLILNEELKTRNVSVSTIQKQFHKRSNEMAKKNTSPLKIASNERRLFAYLIDFLCPLLVLLPINFAAYMTLPISIQDGISMGTLLFWVAYLLFKDALKGQSIGKRIFKIRVIDDESGSSCSAQKSFFRNFPSLFGLIDWIFIFGKKQKRLGDHLAGTSVVKQHVG
jgi:uncharacterized RDD family membrane protein YckC